MRYGIVIAMLLVVMPVLAVSSGGPVTPPKFSTVKSAVCEKTDAKGCNESYFVVHPTDVNNDGKMEWTYVMVVSNGGASVCGAVGNCPASMIQEKTGRWKTIWGWGGQTLGLLHSKHMGYRDLVIQEGDSACVSHRSIYIWNGHRYHQTLKAECDYCAERKGKRLPKICHAQFEEIYAM